ncbi:MAG: HD domain-containing protein [Patescibacteria group bacterium]
MHISIPEQAQDIIKKTQQAGFEIYIVGGGVRDILMGRIVKDWDFTTNATPEQIQAIFLDSFYDNAFGTVGIPAKDSDLKPFEITTFRTEFGYSDARRPDRVEWGETLKEDLARRDFTINAIALEVTRTHPLLTNIIDPFKGQKDLKDNLIRAVGDANERFSEDALRMMRAIRIASQVGFAIEEKTLEAIKQNSTLINKIAKERIKDELFKILSSPNPYDGILLLKASSLLGHILPEFEKTFGVDQVSPQRHHIYDVGTHLLMSLKNCKSLDPITRFAALIHDIGKPQTYKKLDNGVITFYNHEMVGAAITKRIADRLKFSNKEKEKLIKLVRWHQFTVSETQTDTAIKRFIRNVGVENLSDIIALRIADRLGSGSRETSWRTEEFKQRLIDVQKQPFSIKDLKVGGNDIMKTFDLKPGPKVGKILNQLFERVEEKKIPNEREILIEEARKLV